MKEIKFDGMKELDIIVAVGKNGEIGRKGDLIWKISSDLKRFKALTIGNAVIMGRKTWESLPKKPLPGRRNIVLTRQKDFKVEGGEVADSIESALKAIGEERAFIIGGAEIYRAFLPYSTGIYLTVVEDTCGDADAFIDEEVRAMTCGAPYVGDWALAEKSDKMEEPGGLSYRYLDYKKIGDRGLTI